MINITVATGMQEMGGIATVLNVLNDGFFQKWDMKFVTSHTNKSLFFGANKLFLFATAVFKLTYLLSFYNVGIVHIHMASRGSYFRKSLFVRLAKLYNAKVVLHLHGAEFQNFYVCECNANKQLRIRQTFNLSDVVIVLSSQWLSWMKTIIDNPSKARVVYNSVSSLEIDRSHAEQGLILFLGRLGKRKGVKDLIDAFSIVLKDIPHARLALGGDGDIAEFKHQVASLGISNNVDFLGWISGKEKETWLSKADIYCLPSYNEGFPMGVIEAMSARVPIVASTAGGIPDAIEHGLEGLLVQPGDIDTLASHLQLLIDNRQTNAEFSQSAHLKFGNSFSKKAVFPKLDSIYKELLDV
ncbi:glycosyltransferase family 4 protein [Enterovibrio sp. ZSDZ42]|uniref:Glycosyltransferase family 4 protein n=1 Tax=Enterovibrio gelatinilyticus TaxID=2899819 RepID=A0ABT5R0B1_9GAMM|nr:glycosyltransferase family 4 protein [Enterovibrio sp. ZSDZ42]MDD1792972.1 glycosyltransferase family 4 protein [Enterovibrio sp. ZSDZ42]